MIIIAQNEEEFHLIKASRMLNEECEFWLVPAYLPRLVDDNWIHNAELVKAAVNLVEVFKKLEPKDEEWKPCGSCGGNETENGGDCGACRFEAGQ